MGGALIWISDNLANTDGLMTLTDALVMLSSALPQLTLTLTNPPAFGFRGLVLSRHSKPLSPYRFCSNQNKICLPNFSKCLVQLHLDTVFSHHDPNAPHLPFWPPRPSDSVPYIVSPIEIINFPGYSLFDVLHGPFSAVSPKTALNSFHLFLQK